MASYQTCRHGKGSSSGRKIDAGSEIHNGVDLRVEMREFCFRAKGAGLRPWLDPHLRIRTSLHA